MFRCQLEIEERGGKAEKAIDEVSEVGDLDGQAPDLDLKEGYPHCQKQSVNATKQPDWLLYVCQKRIMALLTETVVTSQECHKRIPNSLFPKCQTNKVPESQRRCDFEFVNAFK